MVFVAWQSIANWRFGISFSLEIILTKKFDILKL